MVPPLWLPTARTCLEPGAQPRGSGASVHVGVYWQVSQSGAESPWVSSVTFPREVLLLAASLPRHSAGKEMTYKEPSLGLKF